ncbi:MAG: hypothetical protein GY853_14115 [PVC group bacterium]|nr:hypothetical protein [PVC group bacterium]
MGIKSETECPKCRATYHNIKHIRKANKVMIVCSDCAYEWSVSALDKKVITEEAAIKIISKSDLAEMKAIVSENMVEKIVDVMLNKIIGLVDDE